MLLQLPDQKDQEGQRGGLLPHQPRVPAPGCDLQGEEWEGDLHPGQQAVGQEVPAELPGQLLLHPQLAGWLGTAGTPPRGDTTKAEGTLLAGAAHKGHPPHHDDPHHCPEGKGWDASPPGWSVQTLCAPCRGCSGRGVKGEQLHSCFLSIPNRIKRDSHMQTSV
ncbi:hypothetical protein RLOC_00009065, partial [Lonchura striata]